MPDTTDTSTTSQPALPGLDFDQLNKLVNFIQGGMTPQQQQQGAPASRSWTSLLGEAMAGGESPLYHLSPSDREAAGNRALLQFGIGMLASPYNTTMGEALARGLGGAGQSLLGSQEAAYTVAGQLQAQRLAAIKEALPMLQYQYSQDAAAAALRAARGGPPGAPQVSSLPGAGAPAPLQFTGDKTKDLSMVAQHESGGDPTALNYVARADPSAYARGATASGKYGITNSSWAEGARLAGVDITKYPTAMSAPEKLQDQVAGAIYDKYGSAPWDASKFSQNWVRGLGGGYTLQPVTRGTPPAGPGAPGAAPAAPAVQMGGQPPPPPGGAVAPTTGYPSQGGGIGQVLTAPPVVRAQPGPATSRPPGQASLPVPSDVAAMQRGMQLAQAAPIATLPTTLAAGPGGPAPPAAPAAPAAEPGWGSAVGNYNFGPGAAAGAAPAQAGKLPPPPSQQYPDVVSGDVTIRHPGDFASYYQTNRTPTPTTGEFNPNLPPDQEAGFERRLDVASAIFDPTQRTQEINKIVADREAARLAQTQKAAAAQAEFEKADRSAVQQRYDAGVTAYNQAAQSKFGFHQDIVKSQAEKMDAANQKMLEPFDTGATQAQAVLNISDIAKQVLPGLPTNAAPWLENEGNRARLAALEPYMPENWRQAVQSADLFTQIMGSMVSAMGANIVSGQPGGRQSAYEQFKTMLPRLSQSAEGRETALIFMDELAKRRLAEADFLHNWQSDPNHRDPTLLVPNMTGALTAMNQQLGPMVRLPPLGFDPETVTPGSPMARSYEGYFKSVRNGGRYFYYRRGDDGVLHPEVLTKVPDQPPGAVGE